MRDFKRLIVVAAVAALLCAAALVWVAFGKDKPSPIHLDLPDVSEVTVCYYVADTAKPYEQVWYGGERLEGLLAELAAIEFTEATEDPVEGAFRSALVVATNEEQIMVQWDREYRAWVFWEGRWVCEKN